MPAARLEAHGRSCRCARASSQPMQRVPLPQAADSDPSVLKMVTNASVPGVRGGVKHHHLVEGGRGVLGEWP